jgi:hypothetical protein
MSEDKRFKKDSNPDTPDYSLISAKTFAYRKIIREMSKEISELKAVVDYLYEYIENFECVTPEDSLSVPSDSVDYGQSGPPDAGL